MGSPPHTRGIRYNHKCYPRLNGFTPAYAGNTMILTARTCPFKVHPRSPFKVHPRIRGEYFQSVSTQLHLQGSPPHTRGILSKQFGIHAH